MGNLFRTLSDSLAGRIGIIQLYPFSLKEKTKSSQNIIDILYGDIEPYILKKLPERDLITDIIDGGYPELLKIKTLKGKYLWFSSYIRTYIESDAKELANIRNMDKFIKMYRLCMLRSGNIFNKNQLQIETGLDNKTFDNYFNVLVHTFQIQKLQPYFNNKLKRLIITSVDEY